MISYAQNLEDVVLARALRDVDCGFYVDLGAGDPVVHSVTRHFYDNGWTGIDVEPNPVLARRIAVARSSDRLLEAVVGAPGRGEKATLHVPSEDLAGCATVVEELARALRETTSIQVDRVSLDDVLLLASGRTIDFLKIDVEGLEGEIIESAKWPVHPRIVVVEAVHPVTHEPTHQSWEPFLLRYGYVLCLFDGLNRFYAADDEPPAVKDRLSYPACVLDDFARASDIATRRELEGARQDAIDLDVARQELADAATHNRRLQESARMLRSEVVAIGERARSQTIEAAALRRALASVERRGEQAH